MPCHAASILVVLLLPLLLVVLLLQGCEIGQQAFALMSPTQRPYELGDGGKTGNLLTMFLTGPLMAFCLASGNTDPSIQQLVDLQVGSGG
jgi:ABC-type Fe3+ transport system permease subunit